MSCFWIAWTSLSLAAGGTLKIIPHADLKNTDPIWTTAYITRNHGYMIYDTLFSLDANLQPQPQMVETWNVSDDKLTYTFTLRPGLQWHDGAPVQAADCVASIKRWGKRDGMGQKLMDFTDSLDVVDARLEKLRDDWARATEPAAQKDIAVEIQRVAYDIVPYVNYGQWFLPTAYRSHLKGVIVSPVPFFWNIEKE